MKGKLPLFLRLTLTFLLFLTFLTVFSHVVSAVPGASGPVLDEGVVVNAPLADGVTYTSSTELMETVVPRAGTTATVNESILLPDIGQTATQQAATEPGAIGTFYVVAILLAFTALTITAIKRHRIGYSSMSPGGSRGYGTMKISVLKQAARGLRLIKPDPAARGEAHYSKSNHTVMPTGTS